MRITPLDIRKQEFRKAMRGLDPEEVYAFLSTVAEEYESILSDNKALRERVLELDDKVHEYRTMERTLRDTLLTAERVTADAKENARREANLIIQEAQIEAEKVLRGIKNQAMKLRQDVQELRRERESYLARMKMLAESYLKFIEGEEDFEESERTARLLAEDEDPDEMPAKRSQPEAATAKEGERIGSKPLSSSLPEESSPQEVPDTGLPKDEEYGVDQPPPDQRSSEEEPSFRELSQATDATARPTASSRSPAPAVPSPTRVEPPEADATQIPDVRLNVPERDRESWMARAAEIRRTVSPLPDVAAQENVDSDSPLDEVLPDLNAILDRIVEGQKEILRGETGAQMTAGSSEESQKSKKAFEPMPPGDDRPAKEGAASTERPRKRARVDEKTQEPSSPVERESKWSLEQIKRDILSDPSVDGGGE